MPSVKNVADAASRWADAGLLSPGSVFTPSLLQLVGRPNGPARWQELDPLRKVCAVARRSDKLSQVFVVFSVVIKFHGLDCWRDRTGLTGPQKLVAGLGGSRSMERHIRFFQLQCLFSGEQ